MDRDELDARIERSLAELGAATAGIEPDAGLTDAIVAAAEKVEPAGDALSGIARATAGLDAEKGLADAVMGRVERVGPVARVERVERVERLEPVERVERVGAVERVENDAGGARAGRATGRATGSWLSGVTRSGPAALAVAALAAAACFALFVSSEREVEAAWASSVDTVEVGE